MSVILRIENLAISFGAHVAVRGISLSLRAGETHALVGESGSGKSATALAILGLLGPGAHVDPASRLLFGDQNLLQCDDAQIQRVRGAQIGMIFQEPLTALNPLHTVAQQIQESIQCHETLDRVAESQRLDALLEMVGLQALQVGSRYPHQLSGGQRQRVMIAMALAARPQILIADEPTTALDVTTQSQILSLLRTLQQQLGMAMLFITHDLNVVRRVADTVTVLKEGRVVEQGPAAAVLEHPTHSYTRALLQAEPRGAPAPFDSTQAPLLEVKDLCLSLTLPNQFWQRKKSQLHVLEDIALTLRPGETLGVVGESGCGKTSLSMAILRLQQAQGQILFAGCDITNLSARAMRPLRRDMQIVFQDPFSSLSPRMTAAQIVAEGARAHGLYTQPSDLTAAVRQSLEEVGIPMSAHDRYPHAFSGGQRQRIALARVLILKPRLLILDEPTSALDRSVQAEILDLLRRLQAAHNLAYLFISHDLKVVRAVSHRVMIMRAGRIVESGSIKDVYENPVHPYTRALLSDCDL